jgi:hypothetical protein
MSLVDMDQLHGTLDRIAGHVGNYQVEIIEGAIVMSPVRPFHSKTIRLLWDRLESQLSDEWQIVSDVAMPVQDDTEFAPDLAVIPAVEEAKNLSKYSHDLVELAVEVVSPSSVRNDYEVKVKRYAEAGIPVYLIFDPYRAECTALWNLGAGGYQGRDTIPYGKPVSVETPVGRLLVETAGLPVDPSGRTKVQQPQAPAG